MDCALDTPANDTVAAAGKSTVIMEWLLGPADTELCPNARGAHKPGSSLVT